ncbi:MAG TPA: methylmalonyl Co-A mutase-associated GTPase MeaB [Acidobacteriaceae bacterium]
MGQKPATEGGAQQAGELFEAIRAGERRALARAISLVVDSLLGGEKLLALCEEAVTADTAQALRIGITGPAGAGKSTLIDALTRQLRGQGKRVGILAVDPSSPFTGGAILGDRIRLADFAADPDVYMRSIATRGHLGGLAAAAEDVLTVFEAAAFDVLLIETTGVGQGEVEIASLVDVTAVVMVPGMGDGIQSLKAGILEIANIYVLNKADRPGIEQLEAEIEEMLALRHVITGSSQVPAICRTIATTGEGIPELLAATQACLREPRRRLPHPKSSHGALGGAPVLDHLGIAVRSLAQSTSLYALLGADISPVETVEHERVQVQMVDLGQSRIELLEAIATDSVIGRFLEKRGEGLHHVALRVPELAAVVERLRANQIRLVSDSIQIGAGGHRYLFLHPSSANGVLLELVESAPIEPAKISGGGA